MDEDGRRPGKPAWRRSRSLLGAAAVVAAVAVVGTLAGTGHLGPHRSTVGGTGSGPSPRSGAAMAWDDATHSVLLFGGRSATGYMNDTWSWDGSSWHQLSPAASPPARSGALMAADGHGGLVLFGGSGDIAGGRGSHCVPPGLVPGTTPQSDRSRVLVPAPTPQPVPEGQAPFCGLPISTLQDTWTWDGTTWTRQHPAHGPTGGPGIIAFDSGSKSAVMLVHQLITVSASSGSCFVAPVSPPRVPPTAQALPSPPPQVTCATPQTVPAPPAPALPALWRWTGSDWATFTAPPNGAIVVALATDPGGGLLAVTKPRPTPLPAAPRTGAQCPQASGAPTAVCPPVAAPVIRAIPPSTTLRLDGSGRWQVVDDRSTPTIMPPLATDLAANQVVSFSAPGETLVWTGHGWTGHGWTPSSPEHGPDPRDGAALAYDDANHTVVLFGGATSVGLVADTWTWHGSSWTHVAGVTPQSTSVPSPEQPIPIYAPRAVPTPRPTSG